MHKQVHAMTSMAVIFFVTTRGLVCSLPAPQTIAQTNQAEQLAAEHIYQEQLKFFAADAQEYFETIQQAPMLAVVFDIDETILDARRQSTVITYQNHVYSYYPSLASMRTLYHYLTTRNFPIFFVSSRPETCHEQQDIEIITMYNIISEGCTPFRALFCKPSTQDALSPALWKLCMRKRIQSMYGYTIIATFDDDPSVFAEDAGACTGKQFLVPKGPTLRSESQTTPEVKIIKETS